MKILNATYGGVTCTDVISKKIKNGLLIVRSNNDLIGDPTPGTIKTLELMIELNGEFIVKKATEGQLLVYPEPTNERLGIFYSNNNTPAIYPAIKASLQSIKVAAEGKADILTCMWYREPDNPFHEHIAWTQTSSHLNQLLQIMQLLYSAREYHSYKYVSFLEHDVLYPESYFDYPEFESGIMFTNMNYMGMNKQGYQPLGQRDEPFHQITMRFDDAIQHCMSILPNALITNSGMIEPQQLQRKQWECKNPSIHINHGYHFTSHFNVYRKDNIFQTHPYWGDYEKWKHLVNV